jgi:4,5-DOPA dioxygenase extradiol
MSNPRRHEPLRYAASFADWLKERLAAHDVEAIVAYRERAPDAVRAHPTDEHFLPLFVAWGAAGTDAQPERIVDGFEAGALALDSYLFHPARGSVRHRAVR